MCRLYVRTNARQTSCDSARYLGRSKLGQQMHIEYSHSKLITMTHIIILSVVFGVCCALTEKSEYATTTEHPKRLSDSEDRLLANVIRDKNSSDLLVPDSIDEEGTTKTDKKPRTILHRDTSLERDKSTCFRLDHNFFFINPKSKARQKN